MSEDPKDEFEIEAFADYYEELSDSFIDMATVTASLKSQLDDQSQIFEIGLGTGYFAKQFHRDYMYCGIEPSPIMLHKLRTKNLEVEIKGQQYLQDYVFDSQYDVIVSHSSVFLFTKLEALSFVSGEEQVVLVFQAWMKNAAEVFDNIERVMDALRPHGRFFINIQTNPPARVEVGPAGDKFVFEMVKCKYYFDLERVEKIFRATYRGEIKHMNETQYALRYYDFKRTIEDKGLRVGISDDREWVVIQQGYGA